MILMLTGCWHLAVMGVMEKAITIHKYTEMKEQIEKLEKKSNKP